ncbi:MAG: hypothetical protein R6U37_06765 [Dehalococcoidia bacterium]
MKLVARCFLSSLPLLLLVVSLFIYPYLAGQDTESKPPLHQTNEMESETLEYVPGSVICLAKV